MPRKNMHVAQKQKKDEFYTQLADIERELKHYKDQFRGKVVFCNCDDPKESSFIKYFSMNFEHLGLKKLIATHYKEANLFTQEQPYKLEYSGDKDGNRMPDPSEFMTEMISDGDFRSEECIELLKEADIIVTNPPFSLFREYVAQLINFNKKFLIIGHQNAITYKEIFKLIKEDKIWLGYGFKGGAGHFINRHYEDYAVAGDHIDGMIRVSGVNWFTNLDVSKRHENLVLYKKYSSDHYPKYDNFDAINVDKTTEIPADYDGVIGVPITFLDKHNPEQFEIVALGNSRDNFTPDKNYINPKKILKDGEERNGNAINSVLVINQIEKPANTIYYVSNNSDYLIAPYARILIRRRVTS